MTKDSSVRSGGVDNPRSITVYSVGEALRAKMRTCGVCAGSGNLLSTRYGLTWWPCPCCGGAGVEAMRQAPTFRRARAHMGTGG